MIKAQAHRIGAVFYIVWGLLHLYAAYLSFELGGTQASGLVRAKLFQNGWDLALIALICMFVAGYWNWRNSLTGYWLNLVLVSATDIGFLVLIYAPGHNNDLLGPIMWLIAAAFTTLGILANPRTR